MGCPICNGFVSTATRVSSGTNSLRSCTRLELSSSLEALNPVTFPPGRDRLAARPTPTGSTPATMTIGMVWGGFLGRQRCRAATHDQDIDLETEKLDH